MAHYISVGDLKETLAACPICFEQFDKASRLPRRMSCCLKSVCHTCLEDIFARHGSPLSCPFCRSEHAISSVVDFAQDGHTMDILDFVKIAKGVEIPCTECPDGNEAFRFCEECRDFLCPACWDAHVRARQTRDHVTSSFDDIKSKPLNKLRNHKCQEHHLEQQFFCFTCSQVLCVSCTAYEHKQHQYVPVSEGLSQTTNSFNLVLDQFKENIATFERVVSSLKDKQNNLELSSTSSKSAINKIFDTIQSELETRRDELLAAVEEKKKTLTSTLTQAIDANETRCSAMKSLLDNLTELRKSSDDIENIRLMSSASSQLQAMSKQDPRDVSFVRAGIAFGHAYTRQLRDMLKVSGVVRVVRYEDTQKPSLVRADEYYHAILQDPVEIPPVPEMEVTISRDPVIVCPSLEWDSVTASEDVTVQGGDITNIRPDPPVHDSGCRIRSKRTAVSTRPYRIGGTDRVMVAGKGQLKVKNLLGVNKLLFELALTPLPVSSGRCQRTGVSVRVVTCRTHNNKLCLEIDYDNTVISHTPVIDNRVGGTLPLNLALLLDGGKQTVFVVNLDKGHVMSTVPGVSFDKPLWGLVCVGLPENTDVSWELISGRGLSRDTTNFLSSLC